METQKIINLLFDSNNQKSKFAKKMVCHIQSNNNQKRYIHQKLFYQIWGKDY